MKKLVVLLALSCTIVGCKDSYRYPCQDPDNFGKEECQHPKCEVTGYCSDDLVGHKVYADIEKNKTGGDQSSPVEPGVVESKIESKEHCNCANKGE